MFSKKDQKIVWKKLMEKMMNVENAWDQNTEIGTVKNPVEGVSLKKIIIVMKKMKFGKAAGFSEVSIKMINGTLLENT